LEKPTALIVSCYLFGEISVVNLDGLSSISKNGENTYRRFFEYLIRKRDESEVKKVRKENRKVQVKNNE
jgi:hypothetical protein